MLRSSVVVPIEDESLVQREYHNPYEPFGPETALSKTVSNLTDLRELAGDAKVIDVTGSESADACGHTIRELSEEGRLEEGLLIVAIERGEDVVMPNGGTEIRGGDVVTVLTKDGDAKGISDLFTSEKGLADS